MATTEWCLIVEIEGKKRLAGCAPNPHKPGCGRMAYSWRFGRAEPCLCGAEPQYMTPGLGEQTNDNAG